MCFFVLPLVYHSGRFDCTAFNASDKPRLAFLNLFKYLHLSSFIFFRCLKKKHKIESNFYGGLQNRTKKNILQYSTRYKKNNNNKYLQHFWKKCFFDALHSLGKMLFQNFCKKRCSLTSLRKFVSHFLLMHMRE